MRGVVCPVQYSEVIHVWHDFCLNYNIYGKFIVYIILEGSSVIIIMSAASIAASDPNPPIAIPISAKARTGASFIPSPTMTTLCPSALSSLIRSALSSGSTCDLYRVIPKASAALFAAFAPEPLPVPPRLFLVGGKAGLAYLGLAAQHVVHRVAWSERLECFRMLIGIHSCPISPISPICPLCPIILPAFYVLIQVIFDVFFHEFLNYSVRASKQAGFGGVFLGK